METTTAANAFFEVFQRARLLIPELKPKTASRMSEDDTFLGALNTVLLHQSEFFNFPIEGACGNSEGFGSSSFISFCLAESLLDKAPFAFFDI